MALALHGGDDLAERLLVRVDGDESPIRPDVVNDREEKKEDG
jgi:hypothetical protein